MKSATDEILHGLSAKGYRITRARKRVVVVLSAQTQPISIQVLCAKLKDIDEASVYRTVRTLAEEGFLEEIALAGEALRYALSHGHHHHAVCTSCGMMEHIECRTEKMPVPSEFKTIQSHEVTLYGLCKKCA